MPGTATIKRDRCREGKAKNRAVLQPEQQAAGAAGNPSMTRDGGAEGKPK
jgi:hypothetical protein